MVVSTLTGRHSRPPDLFQKQITNKDLKDANQGTTTHQRHRAQAPRSAAVEAQADRSAASDGSETSITSDQQSRFDQMTIATYSIADSARSVLSGVYSALSLFDAMPVSYAKAFLAVARHEGESVAYYARACGSGSAPMSKRLNDLCETKRKGMTGYGLLTSRQNPMDRRLAEVRLSPKGKALAERIARLVGSLR
jgi:hypothetical protein